MAVSSKWLLLRLGFQASKLNRTVAVNSNLTGLEEVFVYAYFHVGQNENATA